MAFSETELSQMKYFLGYSNMTYVANPWIDIAMFWENLIKNNVDADGEQRIRSKILPALEDLEMRPLAQLDRRQADELIDELKLNKNELNDILTVREFYLCAIERVIGFKRRSYYEGGGSNEMVLY